MSNAAEMDAQEIINYIATAPKKTPVKLYVREKPGMKALYPEDTAPASPKAVGVRFLSSKEFHATKPSA